MSRVFKLTIPGLAAPVIVFADSVSLAEKHARSLMQTEEGAKFECRPLTAAEYKTVDFTAETFVRVPGGKEDAALAPYAISLNGATVYKLASSQSNADKYLALEIQRLSGAKVEPLAPEDYSGVDWSKVETVSEKAEPAAAGAESGDAGKQTDLSDIPGMA